MSRLAAGRNGTREEAPKPFRVLVKAAPLNGEPETYIVGVAAKAEASTVT